MAFIFLQFSTTILLCGNVDILPLLEGDGRADLLDLVDICNTINTGQVQIALMIP